MLLSVKEHRLCVNAFQLHYSQSEETYYKFKSARTTNASLIELDYAKQQLFSFWISLLAPYASLVSQFYSSRSLP